MKKAKRLPKSEKRSGSFSRIQLARKPKEARGTYKKLMSSISNILRLSETYEIYEKELKNKEGSELVFRKSPRDLSLRTETLKNKKQNKLVLKTIETERGMNTLKKIEKSSLKGFIQKVKKMNCSEPQTIRKRIQRKKKKSQSNGYIGYY
jgi:hypothetical protein